MILKNFGLYSRPLTNQGPWKWCFNHLKFPSKAKAILREVSIGIPSLTPKQINFHLLWRNLEETSLAKWSKLVSLVMRQADIMYLLTWCTDFTAASISIIHCQPSKMLALFWVGYVILSFDWFSNSSYSFSFRFEVGPIWSFSLQTAPGLIQ